MSKKMINDLVKRANCLRASERLNHGQLAKTLGIKFSQDFILLNSQIGFDYFGNFAWFNSDQTESYSIIGETIRLRNTLRLPHNILFLTEDDSSLVFMKCLGDHEEIYWITIEDGENFCEGKPLQYDYTYFPTFPDFFKFLLDEEEKMRAEEK